MDPRPFYPWIVFVHVAAAFVFVLAHGVSVFASYRIRRDRDPNRTGVLLELSLTSLYVAYPGLAVLLLAGIVAGVVGGHFARLWIWLALAILLGVAVAMYLLATRYYARVRSAVELPSGMNQKEAPPPAPATPEELERLLDSRRPDVIAAVGAARLLAIIWLMLVKPF